MKVLQLCILFAFCFFNDGRIPVCLGEKKQTSVYLGEFAIMKSMAGLHCLASLLRTGDQPGV